MLKWKKLFVSLLSVSVIAGLGAAPVKAAQTVTPYTYKVTLSAGNKGTINGQQKVEEVDLAAGSTVSFDINDIKVSDEKYYVKGIRLSGRDNSEALAAPAFRVNGDADSASGSSHPVNSPVHPAHGSTQYGSPDTCALQDVLL